MEMSAVRAVVDLSDDIPCIQVLSWLFFTERDVKSYLVDPPSFAVQQGGSDVRIGESSTPGQSPSP